MPSVFYYPDLWCEGTLAWMMQLSRCLLSCTHSNVIYKGNQPIIQQRASARGAVPTFCGVAFARPSTDAITCCSQAFIVFPKLMPKNNHGPAWLCPASCVSDHHSAQIGDIEAFMALGVPRGPSCLDIFLPPPQKGHSVCGCVLMCHLGLTLTQGSKSLSIVGGTITFEPLICTDLN